MNGAYYNEVDPGAAAWLRELIKRNLIAPGDVDERSIVDVRPSDVMGYRQCHWFAGIGVWSHALRLAGWEDGREVWTGSCPCQPFSAAGKGEGYADERHLWPHWHRLIRECRPRVIFGEQVASSLIIGSTNENVQRLRRVQAAHRLSEIFWRDARWAQAALQAMPEGLREELAQSQRGQTSQGSLDTLTEGASIRSEVSSRESGGVFGGGMSSAMHQARNTFRFGCPTTPNSHQCRKVRSERLCLGCEAVDGAIPAQTRFAFLGSNQSEEGLCDEQRQGGLFGCEPCPEQLGRSGSPSDPEGVDGEEVDETGEPDSANEDHGGPAKAAGWAWIDDVFDDLESVGYACAAVSFPACSVGAPHVRQRLYFVAESGSPTSERNAGSVLAAQTQRGGEGEFDGDMPFGHSDGSATNGLAESDHPERRANRAGGHDSRRQDTGRAEGSSDAEGCGELGGLADTPNSDRRPGERGTQERVGPNEGWRRGLASSGADGVVGNPKSTGVVPTQQRRQWNGAFRAGPTNGFWANAEWIPCTDGKARPVEPGVAPLVTGASARVVRLRGYGNSIVAPQAQAFIQAYMSIER